MEDMMSTDIERQIRKLSREIIRLINYQHYERLSNYISPIKGVVFTPYTVIVKENLRFYGEEVALFGGNTQVYTWGEYDGSGKKIDLTPKEYFREFVYSHNFIECPFAYNKILHKTGWIENIDEVYLNSPFIEYYYHGNNEQGIDTEWSTLRLVFEQHQTRWYVVGIIHSQWTI